jgi:hypothetical protein
MVGKLKYTAVLLLIISSVLVSCKSVETKDSYIRIEVNETEAENGKVIQIPSFVSDNEEIQKKLRDLDKETEDLSKIVEKEQKKGADIEMRSYVGGTKNYPQVTVVWYVVEENSRFYNLITLAADRQACEPITCKEALERTEMSGVDLSLKVGKLAQKSAIRGQLQKTEMQGFKIGEDGKVKEIYMKLTLEIEDEEEDIFEEHFFSYILDSEELVSLSEKGFDIP